MPNLPAQRSYRAPCPGCGAPVDFRSAQSTHAVCGYCQSTVVRQGEVLARLGKMSELFDDHSPLQLQCSGRYQNQGFALVGRLQYQYAQGRWTEWIALFDDGGTGFLSEDNGAYVFSRPSETGRSIPEAPQFRVGLHTAINGKPFTVASNEQVSLSSAQGELPHLPPLGSPFAMVELRSPEGKVLSIDYGSTPPTLALGQAVLLDDLSLSGLREDNDQESRGRQFDCPHCGAPVTVTLSESKSITCGSCHTLIDVSKGIGGELRHALQDEPVQPLVPMGAQGLLQGVTWQVVGFQHRVGQEPGDEEQFGWEEYLLYNRKRGFTFLVDATDGWSVVKPTTGAPTTTESGTTASYLGQTYRLKDSYNAETTYVAGEFYWQVERGQRSFNRDYQAGNNLLSNEKTQNELTWSAGTKVDSTVVAKAFGLEDKQALLQRSDVAPLSFGAGISLRTAILIFLVVMVVLFLMTRCGSRCDPNYENCSSSSTGGSTRTTGGSYGGYSSGGGHK